MSRRDSRPVIVVLLGIVMLIALALLSNSARDSDRLQGLYDLLMVINVIGLLTLLVLIGMDLKRLFADLRRGAPGIRLKFRMVAMFVALAIVPVLVVYGFSVDFLSRGIDNWFDVRVEEGLQDALLLSRQSLDLHEREALASAREMAAELAGGGALEPAALNLRALSNPDSFVVANNFLPSAAELESLRARGDARELSLHDQTGTPLVSTRIAPERLSRAIVSQLGQEDRVYMDIDPPASDGRIHIRVAVNVPNYGLGIQRQILHGLFPVPGDINVLAASVEAAIEDYNQLDYLRGPLKMSFIMTLTLVLLFGILMSIWVVIYFADLLAAPIRDLAEGTRAVAEGDYATSLPVTSQDELGFLVQSFNEMTRRVAQARDEVIEQRHYLETVLSKLSSGVLTFDADRTVIVVNDAAAQILDIDTESLVNRRLDDVAEDNRVLASFRDAIAPHIQRPGVDWQEQIVTFGDRRKILMCRGTSLAGQDGSGADIVVVFDDITELIKGQREAAWSDVARRLAHEIKNPLTPIQLAAERLRRKYLGSLDAEGREVLDRLTNTIIQQVGTMKGMVNTFSEYARPPTFNAEPLDLNALIGSVAELFRTANPHATIATRFDSVLPMIRADGNRLRQVFNNLIMNALEATPEGENAEITLTTRNFDETQLHYVEITIEDRGIGIDRALMDDIFEPYVTNKPKGTGLGLAIAKKIIEEHGGIVSLENVEGGGARATVRLPRQIALQEGGSQERAAPERYFA